MQEVEELLKVMTKKIVLRMISLQLLLLKKLDLLRNRNLLSLHQEFQVEGDLPEQQHLQL